MNKQDKVMRRFRLAKQEGFCTLCSPHKGCNGGKHDRSWKRHRKNKWKEKL